MRVGRAKFGWERLRIDKLHGNTGVTFADETCEFRGVEVGQMAIEKDAVANYLFQSGEGMGSAAGFFKDGPKVRSAMHKALSKGRIGASDEHPDPTWKASLRGSGSGHGRPFYEKSTS